MTINAFLYDATGTDRTVELNVEVVVNLHDQQLLWVDLNQFNEEELLGIGTMFGLHRETVAVESLSHPDRRPRLDNYGSYFQLHLNSIEDDEGKYRLAILYFIIGQNYVLTIHDSKVSFLQDFDTRVKGDSLLGQLDAPAFLAALLDWHVTSFFRVIEQLEARVDRLDTLALRSRHSMDILTDLARLRQRVALIRRTLTPHREVYAALARPDFLVVASSDSAVHFTVLNGRLEHAIDSVENARELLVGSFDMFTTQTALRTNEAMKTLTLVSVLLLPASVIIGIATFLIKTPVYPFGPVGFWIMLGCILSFSFGTLFLVKWKNWI